MRLFLLLLVVQTSAGCAHLTLAPDERREARELPGVEEVPGSAGGDVGATASGWYSRATLGQFVDPFKPTFKTATISGALTVGGTLTAPTFASVAAMTVNPGTTWAVHGSNFDVGANGDVTSITKFISNVASGNDAFKVATSGARWHVGTGASDYFSSDSTTVTFAGPIASAVTVGTSASGTGITAAASGGLRTFLHKVTVTNAAMTAAATTDVTLAVTPVNSRINRVVADVTQVFTGGALTAVTVMCGNAAGGNQYLLANSVFTAQATWGDVVAEMGAGVVDATRADFGTVTAGVPGAITVQCRFTCTGANCNAATQGSVTFYVEGVTY